jgi:hypothetical protein
VTMIRCDLTPHPLDAAFHDCATLVEKGFIFAFSW